MLRVTPEVFIQKLLPSYVFAVTILDNSVYFSKYFVITHYWHLNQSSAFKFSTADIIEMQNVTDFLKYPPESGLN